MQDMLLTVGAWDNVCDGINKIIVKTSHLPDIIAYIKPGRYIQLPKFVPAINNALNVEHFKYVNPRANDETHTLTVSSQGFG